MTGDAPIAIRPLADHADAIPEIARWFFAEWRAIYGEETLASVQQRITTWATRGRLPTALVAVSDGQVIGTVALKVRELEFPYSPWLAGLFVIPSFRHRGVDARLVRAAEREATSLGVTRLYLYTPASQGFYERLGWSLIEQCQLPSGPVAVMSRPLASDAGPVFHGGAPSLL